MYTKEQLDFAYKYPFSSDAKAVLESLKINAIDYRYMELGKERIMGDMDKNIHIVNISLENVKISEILSYAYARMIVSALDDKQALSNFIEGEQRRAGETMKSDTAENLMKIASELKVKIIDNKSEFLISLGGYLKNIPKGDNAALVNQKLSGGFIIISRPLLVGLLASASKSAIMHGLPIRREELPKDIIKFSKTFTFKPAMTITVKGGNSRAWIERVLETPIPDVRHRVVNLVLAPYLVTVKKMSPEDAYAIILDYIERCKKINPDTKINEQYIMYQCRYAKSKGLKPLSLVKARELLAGMINFD